MNSVISKETAPKKPTRFLLAVFLSNFLLSFHFFLIIYINSSFLDQFFSPTTLSFLFIAGALANLILLLNGPRLIKKIGNYKLTLLFVLIEFLAVLGLALVKSPLFVGILFIAHQAVILMILFDLDVFLEDYSPFDESQTGSIRGLYLTIANITQVIAPAVAGLILTNGDFWRVYLVSAFFLIPLFLTVKKGLKIKMAEPEGIKVRESFRAMLKNKDLHTVFMVQLILQFFYAWMIIYLPIHLFQNIGFSWTQIGLIFTIMLLPFVLFEIPLGRLADKKIGEKEIMILGFFIASISSAFIPFVKEPVFIVWALLLFATRIGASFIEISSESYFFKHVNASDSNAISIFRITRPIAFIITPAVAAGTLFILSLFDVAYGFSFLILSAVTLYGVRYGVAINDTK
jgi:MFS family permease